MHMVESVEGPEKDTTAVYLALLSRWFWLGKQALVLGHIVWLHPKARRARVPARMHRNKRPGQGWTLPQHRQEREQNRGKEWAYLEKAECTHAQLQAPHYPITVSVFPPPPGRSASVCGWKGQGPAAVQSNKSCRSVNHMCQQGHFYLWYVATAATLPDEIFVSLRGQGIYHSTDSTTHFGETGLQLPRANRQNGSSVSWRCGWSAQSAAQAMTHSSRVLVKVSKVMSSLQSTRFGVAVMEREKLT